MLMIDKSNNVLEEVDLLGIISPDFLIIIYLLSLFSLIFDLFPARLLLCRNGENSKQQKKTKKKKKEATSYHQKHGCKN